MPFHTLEIEAKFWFFNETELRVFFIQIGLNSCQTKRLKKILTK